jgi:hypothetical protein
MRTADSSKAAPKARRFAMSACVVTAR